MPTAQGKGTTILMVQSNVLISNQYIVSEKLKAANDPYIRSSNPEKSGGRVRSRERVRQRYTNNNK